ncbi:MAG TPA: DUF4040 domain-containing protein [Euryarchaeota archaeon]|nr:DUF4040 domain-containing protein [Euryarchaeota archaeon]
MEFGTLDFETVVNVLLIVGLLISVILSILVKDLLKSAISLGVASAILGAIFYMMGSPLAAMVEISVCGGLVTVLFVAAISMTGDGKEEEAEE